MMKNIDSRWARRSAWRPYIEYLWPVVGIVGIVIGVTAWQAAQDKRQEDEQLHVQMSRQAQALELHRVRMRQQSQQGDALAELLADCDDYHAKVLAAEEGAPTETDLWRQIPIELTLETDYLQLIALLAVWESGTPWREVHLLQAIPVAGGARTQATLQIVSYRFIGDRHEEKKSTKNVGQMQQ